MRQNHKFSQFLLDLHLQLLLCTNGLFLCALCDIWAERKEGWTNWAHDTSSRVYLWHRDYCYIPPRPDRHVCVYGEGLRAHEFRMRRAHFAFHFTVLTTGRSFFSGNYIDYFSISRINEPRCSSSPLWSPLHPGDITLLTYTHRTPPSPSFFFFLSQHATWQRFPD